MLLLRTLLLSMKSDADGKLAIRIPFKALVVVIGRKSFSALIWFPLGIVQMYPSWRVQVGNESPTEFEQIVSDQLKGLVEDDRNASIFKDGCFAEEETEN